jgi:hypothetical protein
MSNTSGARSATRTPVGFLQLEAPSFARKEAATKPWNAECGIHKVYYFHCYQRDSKDR